MSGLDDYIDRIYMKKLYSSKMSIRYNQQPKGELNSLMSIEL